MNSLPTLTEQELLRMWPEIQRNTQAALERMRRDKAKLPALRAKTKPEADAAFQKLRRCETDRAGGSFSQSKCKAMQEPEFSHVF